MQDKLKLLSGAAPAQGEQPSQVLTLVMTKQTSAMDETDQHGYRKHHRFEQRRTLDVQRTFFPPTAFLGKIISQRD